MYRIYYLTADIDLNTPMYVGATKLSLENRLISHYRECSNKRMSNSLNWKRNRGKILKIYLLEDNISINDIKEKEQYWIEFWRKINPKLKNSVKPVRYFEKPESFYKNREEINNNIKKAIKHRNKGIVVLNKDCSFYKKYDKIIDCSNDLKIKAESIILSAKNKRQNTKFNFVYEKDYNSNTDYSYMNKFKRKVISIISLKCRENSLKTLRNPCYIQDIDSNEIINFNSRTECANFLGISVKSINPNIKRESISKKRYRIYDSKIKYL